MGLQRRGVCRHTNTKKGPERRELLDPIHSLKIMKSFQNFIFVLTITYLASDYSIASPVQESKADLYEENTGNPYFPCRPGFPLCMQLPLDPPMLKEDEDVNTEADVDSPPVRRSTGSYLFRSRKSFDDEPPRLQQRSGAYLLRTRKSFGGYPRSTRGNYLFRTRKSMDRDSRAGENKYLFRTRKSSDDDEEALMDRMETRAGKGYLFRT